MALSQYYSSLFLNNSPPMCFCRPVHVPQACEAGLAPPNYFEERSREEGLAGLA